MIKKNLFSRTTETETETGTEDPEPNGRPRDEFGNLIPPEIERPEQDSGSGEDEPPDEPPDEPFKFDATDPRKDAFRRQYIEHLQQKHGEDVLQTLVKPSHRAFHNEAAVIETLVNEDKKKGAVLTDGKFNELMEQAETIYTENAAREAKQTPEVVQGLADKLQRDDLKEVVQAHIDAHVAQNNDRPNHDAQYHDVNSYAEHLQSLSEDKLREALEAHHTKAESLKAAREREEETQSKEKRKEAALNDIRSVGQVGKDSTQHHFEEIIRKVNDIDNKHDQARKEDSTVQSAFERVIGAVFKQARSHPQGKAALAQVHEELKEHGEENFGGTKHKAQVEAAHDAAKEDHEEHEEHLNTATNKKFDMDNFNTPESLSSQHQREFGPEDEKQVQGERDKGKSDADIRRDRIARGQAPGPAPRPNLKWHKETHRWINPDTYNDLGKTLKVGENVHIGDPHSFGLAHHDDGTPDGGVVLHRHEDGVRMYTAAQSKLNKFGMNSLDHDEAHNPTHAAHGRGLAAGHLARTGNLQVSEAQLRSRMSAHAGASAMERDFIGKRNKALAGIARGAAYGAAIGAIGGAGFLPAGIIVGAGLAYMGIKNKSRLYRSKVAQDMRTQLGTMSPEESGAIDRFESGGVGTGASSGLSGAVEALASKFSGGSKD